MAEKKEGVTIFKKMTLQKFHDYCDFFSKHDLEELVIEEEGLTLRLKSGDAMLQEQVQTLALPYPMAMAASHGAAAAGNAAIQDAPKSTSKEGAFEGQQEQGGPDPQKTIVAPMSGTFYLSPTPDAPPYIEVGQSITKGTNIGIIEAMKIMNEIESSLTGTIDAILQENGKTVMAGDPLIRLR